jgi:hypothetical protein
MVSTGANLDYPAGLTPKRNNKLWNMLFKKSKTGHFYFGLTLVKKNIDKTGILRKLSLECVFC